jgi:hypothetical protein
VMLDHDTFLVTVYVLVDDIYKQRFAPLRPVRPGPAPALCDSEILTLGLLCQFHPARSEHAFLRFAARYWRSYFPVLPTRSTFNRRMRDLCGAFAALGPEIAGRIVRLMGCAPAYEAMDGAAVPLVRRCRGRGCALFGDGASFGMGGADRGWYYGVKLVCVVDRHGAISGFAACRADTEERWLAEAALRWRPYPDAPQPDARELAEALGPAHRGHGLRTGPQAPVWPRQGAGVSRGCVVLTDRGYSGREWGRHWRESYGVLVATPQGLVGRAARAHNSMRQCVERVFGMLFEGFGLAFPRARSMWGVMTRVSAKIAALNMLVLVNLLFERPPHAYFNPIG